MTGVELLNHLNDRGLMELMDEEDAWFGWRVFHRNGHTMLEVEFSDEESGEESKKTWILTPVEVRGSDKRS